MVTFASLAVSAWGILVAAAAFVLVLSVVVFIHELGHFVVARWCGVTVKTFSIGFGKEIFGFTDSKGTRWRFAWIPLGGYVKFLDDANAASQASADSLAKMTPPGAGRRLSNKTAVEALCGCRGRANCELSLGHCYLHRNQFHIWCAHDSPAH